MTLSFLLLFASFGSFWDYLFQTASLFGAAFSQCFLGVWDWNSTDELAGILGKGMENYAKHWFAYSLEP